MAIVQKMSIKLRIVHVGWNVNSALVYPVLLVLIITRY